MVTPTELDFARLFIAHISDGWGDELEKTDAAELASRMSEYVSLRVAIEREACAKLCEYGIAWHPEPPASTQTYIRETCANLAKAIRRRSPPKE